VEGHPTQTKPTASYALLANFLLMDLVAHLVH